MKQSMWFFLLTSAKFLTPDSDLQLELILSSATVVMAIYSLVAAIFGMNLPYKWNEGYGYIFKWVRYLQSAVIITSFI